MRELLEILGPPVAACVFGGAACGLLGLLVSGLRAPLLGVFTAHSALAGAVILPMLGASQGAGAWMGALAGGAGLGLASSRMRDGASEALGPLFSLVLGAAFLGMALSPSLRSSQMALMLGSPLLVGWSQALILAGLLALLVALLRVFHKETKLLLFSPELAACQLPAPLLLGGLLVLASAILAACLDLVGGLMLYALIANPPAAALRLSRTFRGAAWLSAVFGALSGLAGLAAAYALDLPAGACIALASGLPLILPLLTARRAVPGDVHHAHA